MTDKEKIRDEVKKLKSQLLRGACSSQIAMETICKEEAYNEVLSILDTMQEEPVSKEIGDYDHKAVMEALYPELKEEPISEDLLKELKGIVNIRECVAQGVPVIKIARHFANWQKAKDESTTEDLGEYINELSKQFPEVSFAKLSRIAVRVAKWQKKQCNNEANHALVEQIKTQQLCYEKGMADMKQQMMKNIWKPADGDDLPEIDREVIAILDNGKVVFAHRPPEYWDGKNIITGKVTRYYPKTYDKGGWSIPDVKYWLDVELPK